MTLLFTYFIISNTNTEIGKETTIGSNIDADHAKGVRCLSKINYFCNNYSQIYLTIIKASNGDRTHYLTLTKRML